MRAQAHAEYLEKVIQKQIDLMHDRDIWEKTRTIGICLSA
jgi:hypothetical protein